MALSRFVFHSLLLISCRHLCPPWEGGITATHENGESKAISSNVTRTAPTAVSRLTPSPTLCPLRGAYGAGYGVPRGRPTNGGDPLGGVSFDARCHRSALSGCAVGRSDFISTYLLPPTDQPTGPALCGGEVCYTSSPT